MPEALQDHAEEEEGVEAGHGHEEQVEGVPHPLAGEHHRGHGVADDTLGSHSVVSRDFVAIVRYFMIVFLYIIWGT